MPTPSLYQDLSPAIVLRDLPPERKRPDAELLYTTAELCYFLGREDVCAFFTWPASASGNPLIS